MSAEPEVYVKRDGTRVEPVPASSMIVVEETHEHTPEELEQFRQTLAAISARRIIEDAKVAPEATISHLDVTTDAGLAELAVLHAETTRFADVLVLLDAQRCVSVLREARRLIDEDETSTAKWKVLKSPGHGRLRSDEDGSRVSFHSSTKPTHLHLEGRAPTLVIVAADLPRSEVRAYVATKLPKRNGEMVIV